MLRQGNARQVKCMGSEAGTILKELAFVLSGLQKNKHYMRMYSQWEDKE